MNKPPSFAKKLFITFCAFTKTTEFFARRTGVKTFLPELSALRFANLSGVKPEVLSQQMEGCKSFEDSKWTGYWRSIAMEHLTRGSRQMQALGGPRADLARAEPTAAELEQMGDALGSAVRVFSERVPETIDAMMDSFRTAPARERDAARAMDDLVKAVGYMTIASWPGWTKERLEAYRMALRIFDWLLFSMASRLNLSVEKITVPVAGDSTTVYAVFPIGNDKVPTVLNTNGLEGSIQEVLLPSLRFMNMGMGMVAMEMPGTFAYRLPMSGSSESIYKAVIDRVLAHPRVASDRLGMVGASFGAHWSTRMAARDQRIRAVVSNGGPYHRSFKPSLGVPEIMLSTLIKTLAAKNSLDLGKKMHAMSIQHLFPLIKQPMLAINGEKDTLVSTQDTIDLAAATKGELLLYPDDDHCAMGHYSEWMEYMMRWFHTKL